MVIWTIVATAAPVVHTEGVNWELVATICTILTFTFGILAYYISTRITTSIHKFRIEVISKMETRLALLEMAVFGQNRKSNDSNNV
jgi:hypothetical protein